MTEEELNDIEETNKRRLYRSHGAADGPEEDVAALVAEVRRLRAEMAEAARVLLEERAGCWSCVGEYGRGGASIGYELQEALAEKK